MSMKAHTFKNAVWKQPECSTNVREEENDMFLMKMKEL